MELNLQTLAKQLAFRLTLIKRHYSWFCEVCQDENISFEFVLPLRWFSPYFNARVKPDLFHVTFKRVLARENRLSKAIGIMVWF